MRNLKKPEAPVVNLRQAPSLPTDSKVAVYYRQSSDAQIGNVSTTIQTADMVDYVQHLGWNKDNILLIDADGGVSGTKKDQ